MTHTTRNTKRDYMVPSYRRAWHLLASDKGQLPSSPFAFSSSLWPLPKAKWNEEMGWVSWVAQGEARPQACQSGGMGLGLPRGRQCGSKAGPSPQVGSQVLGDTERTEPQRLRCCVLPFLPSFSAQPVPLPRSCHTERTHVHTEMTFALFKRWIVICFSVGGYIGKFLFLHGVALGSCAQCSEPRGPQWGKSPQSCPDARIGAEALCRGRSSALGESHRRPGQLPTPH